MKNTNTTPTLVNWVTYAKEIHEKFTAAGVPDGEMIEYISSHLHIPTEETWETIEDALYDVSIGFKTVIDDVKRQPMPWGYRAICTGSDGLYIEVDIKPPTPSLNLHTARLTMVDSYYAPRSDNANPDDPNWTPPTLKDYPYMSAESFEELIEKIKYCIADWVEYWNDMEPDTESHPQYGHLLRDYEYFKPEGAVFNYVHYQWDTDRARKWLESIGREPGRNPMANMNLASLMVHVDTEYAMSLTGDQIGIMAEVLPGEYVYIDGHHHLHRDRELGKEHVDMYVLSFEEQAKFLTQESMVRLLIDLIIQREKEAKKKEIDERLN